MNKRTGRKLGSSQSGAATVEAAIILVVFLVLVMAVIEFSLLIYKAASLVEATRVGSRYLVVNDPVVTKPDCDTTSSVNHVCTEGSCAGVLAEMRKFYQPLAANKVEITYRCSSSGFQEAPERVYEVELRVHEIKYHFITAGIFGLNDETGTVTFPDFKSTKISEDLDTVPAS